MLCMCMPFVFRDNETANISFFTNVELDAYLEDGQYYYVESTVDYYNLYCQKHPTLSAIAMGRFVTIIHPLSWISMAVISLLLGVVAPGGVLYMPVSFLRQSISG